MGLVTKQEYQDLMNQIIKPLVPLYSAGGARLNLGDFGTTYFRESMELEGFSRVLWALAPFWAGGGSDEELRSIYINGLKNGSNPEAVEYWGGFSDYDQRFVEMAAIAHALILAPEQLFAELSEKEKKNLIQWLDAINHYTIPDCNWQFFLILVNLSFKKLGYPYCEEKLERALENIESYYIGNGWYQDGASGQKDYYISFAIHYYALLYSKIMNREDADRCETYRERASIFAKDFIYWFAESGEAIPYGRSLTYRWAQNSFWSACIYADIQPFTYGQMKGMIARNFEYWMKQKIFDRDGILTVGYGYPNLIMSERYNSPTSPYWCMKSFLILALPDSHEFWKANIEELPQLDRVKQLTEADMVVQRFPQDVVALTAGVCEKYGHGGVAEKYAKFAYSTKLGFSCSRSSRFNFEAAPDSMLAFIIEGAVFVRTRSVEWKVQNNQIVSMWRPVEGIDVVTTLIPTEEGHLRIHEVHSRIECRAEEYGFSVPQFREHTITTEMADYSSSVCNGEVICTVEGDSNAIGTDVLKANPNTNVLYTNTFIPYVTYRIQKGKNQFQTEVKVKITM